jgi:hypothetical protein
MMVNVRQDGLTHDRQCPIIDRTTILGPGSSSEVEFANEETIVEQCIDSVVDGGESDEGIDRVQLAEDGEQEFVRQVEQAH